MNSSSSSFDAPVAQRIPAAPTGGRPAHAPASAFALGSVPAAATPTVLPTPTARARCNLAAVSSPAVSTSRPLSAEPPIPRLVSARAALGTTADITTDAINAFKEQQKKRNRSYLLLQEPVERVAEVAEVAEPVRKIHRREAQESDASPVFPTLSLSHHSPGTFLWFIIIIIILFWSIYSLF
jgi:hypothetical protein